MCMAQHGRTAILHQDAGYSQHQAIPDESVGVLRGPWLQETQERDPQKPNALGQKRETPGGGSYGEGTISYFQRGR